MTRRSLSRLVRSTLLAFSSLLAGCTYYHVHPGALEPSTARVAPEERAAVWRRAIGVLLDEGYVPEVLNEAASFISARRREDFENDPLAKTLALVYISPDGVVRVQVSGVGYFASEKQFLDAISERQRAILDLILKRAVAAPEGASRR